MTDGDLITIDGVPALRFERRLAYPAERVWRAVSEPAELAQWFVAPVDWQPAPGETFESFGQAGEITELEPGRVLEWLWGGERFRFELEPDSGGCVLVFVHAFGDRDLGAQHATGWKLHLDRLDAHLAGRTPAPYEELLADFPALHDSYAERFGIDPEIGRRAFAEMQEQNPS